MTKIAIIGGSGFIGTQLVKKLNVGNYQIRNFDKRPSNEFPELTEFIDVCDKDSLEKLPADTDIVVLLAAEHTDNVSPISLYYDVNVKGARNVLEVMEKKGIKKIMFTSSVAIYGLNRHNPSETDAADPFNHYGKSKWQAEKVLEEWYSRGTDGKSAIIIRPTVVFGENNRGNVYNLLKQIKSGRFLMIGNGSNKKSMSYVENIVEFIEYLIRKGTDGYNVFNYADKPDLSTAELINIIYSEVGLKSRNFRIPYAVGYLGGVFFDILSTVTGKKFPISAIRIKKFCATTQFSAEKLANTGFKAPFTLREGLIKTIDSIN